MSTLAAAAVSVAVRPPRSCPLTGDCAVRAVILGDGLTVIAVGVVDAAFDPQPATIASTPLAASLMRRRGILILLLQRQQRAAERGRPRAAADPDVAVDRARPGAVLFAEGTVVCAEIGVVGRRVIGGPQRRAEVRDRDPDVVHRGPVDPVLDDEAELVAPGGLPE